MAPLRLDWHACAYRGRYRPISAVCRHEPGVPRSFPSRGEGHVQYEGLYLQALVDPDALVLGGDPSIQARNHAAVFPINRIMVSNLKYDRPILFYYLFLDQVVDEIKIFPNTQRRESASTGPDQYFYSCVQKY